MRRFLFITCLLTATEASAFVIETGRNPSGQVIQLHWPGPSARQGIPFLIDERGSDDIPARESLFSALRQAFKAWESLPVTFVRFSDRGVQDSPGVNSRDRQNVLSFDETGSLISAPPDAGVVALTRINSDDRTGEIFDADIVFNGRDFRFAVGDPAQVRAPIVDLQDVATHEIGHLLGIDHTGLVGPAVRRPTMNPFTNREAPGTPRSPKPDDVAAVGYLYPSEAFSGTGRISGTVRNPDGSGAFGVQVVAYDETGNFVVSGLTGYQTGKGGSGEYAIPGLPPGRYTLGIEPLRGPVTSANFSGIFHQTFDTDFQPEYYDNVLDRNQAEILRVQAGQEISGIGFTTGLFGPGFPTVQNVLYPANTPDPAGPYPVQATIADDKGLARVTLFYRVGGGSYVPLPMGPGQGGVYKGDIPGQARGSIIDYYIEAVDGEGHASVYPTGIPLSLKVLDLTGKPLLYVALRKSNALSVLDAGAGTGGGPAEVARIPLAEDPIGLVITPDERWVAVTSRAGNTVTLIETATHRVAAVVGVGREPVNAAASPDSRFVYVNNTIDGSVSVIDLGRRQELRRIAVTGNGTGSSPPGPYGIALSPDGFRVYVTMINDNVVVALDASSGSELARIPVVPQPRSLALTPDGSRLYVAGLSEGAGLSVINTTTFRVEATIAVPAAARAFSLAVSPNGQSAYVADYTNNLIVLDTAANQVSRIIPIPGQNTRGVAVSADGATVYVTNQDSDDLFLVEAASGRLLLTVSLPQGPRDIALRNRPIQAGSDPQEAAAADFDGDGQVGLPDFFLFAGGFGKAAGQSGFEARFDLNRDDQVGFSDFFLFAGQFGKKTR